MRYELIAARILLAQLFVLGAVQKALDPAPAQSLLEGLGMPGEWIWLGLGLNAVVAFAFLTGWRMRQAAWAAALYCAGTSVFHLVPDDPWQMTIVVKNWALAGGCLALASTTRETP